MTVCFQFPRSNEHVFKSPSLTADKMEEFQVNDTITVFCPLCLSMFKIWRVLPLHPCLTIFGSDIEFVLPGQCVWGLFPSSVWHQLDAVLVQALLPSVWALETKSRGSKSILTWESFMCQRLVEHQAFASTMNMESPLFVWVTSDFPFLLPAPLKLALITASYKLLGRQRQKHSENILSSPDWMLGWSPSEFWCWILTP